MLAPDSKILIVDDFRTMRRMIAKALKNLGLENYHEADDGRTALPMIKKAIEENAPFDIILSDWNMPGMAGIDLLKEFRALEGQKTVPFLLITAEGEQNQILEAAKAGVTDYIVKPFSPDTLKAKLEQVSKKMGQAS